MEKQSYVKKLLSLMKRNLRSFLFVLLFGVISGTVCRSSYGQIEFGVKGAAGLSWLSSNVKDYSSLSSFGFEIGPAVHIGIPVLPFAVEVGISFKKADEELQYLQMPVMVKLYSPFKKISFFMGMEVYGSVKLGGKDFWTGWENQLIKINSYDYGWGPVFGFRFAALELYIGCRFGRGNIAQWEKDGMPLVLEAENFFGCLAFFF